MALRSFPSRRVPVRSFGERRRGLAQESPRATLGRSDVRPMTARIVVRFNRFSVLIGVRILTGSPPPTGNALGIPPRLEFPSSPGSREVRPEASS